MLAAAEINVNNSINVIQQIKLIYGLFVPLFWEIE